MLDQRVTDFIHNAVAAKAPGLDAKLHVRLRDIGNVSTQHGQYGGSRMYVQFGTEYAQELGQRAELVFEQMKRALAAFPPASLDSLHADLQAALLTELGHQRTHLNGLAQGNVRAGAAFGDDGRGGIHLRVNEEHGRLCDQYAKVDLLEYVVALKRQGTATGQSANTLVFNAPVGTVQTGANATAHVVMNLGADERKALVDALEVVARIIRDSQQLAHEQQREVLEIVATAQMAAQAKQPNERLLRAMFPVICETLQTLADIGPAMAALSAAALPFGIYLSV